MCHSFMRITERQTFFDQIVSQIGCRGVALECCGAHCIRLHADTGSQIGKNTQRVDQCVHRVEQRFFVFLIVFVVRQRLAFHQGQQGDQMTIHATGFATRQLRYVRIFLLRHDRRAGTETVCHIDEANARTHPDNQLFRHTRNMRHDQRSCSTEFNREIAVRHRIQRVVAHRIKAQCGSNTFTVNRKGRASQRRCTQRQAVHAFAAIEQTFSIAAEHFHIRQHMMTESNRLRHLHMGEARQYGIGILFCQINQRSAQIFQ